jgi:plasmid stabilization system protein ParE
MILPTNFHRAALAEVEDAFKWYEEKEQGLGEEFRRALDYTIDAIRGQPFGFQIIYGIDVRRAIMHRFPYSVIYIVHRDSILVLAVFHMSRDPEVWQRRD